MPKKRKTQDEYRRLDRARCLRIARLGVTFHAAEAAWFNGGSNVGDVYRRLAERGLIEIQSRSLARGLSTYTLGPLGAKELGRPHRNQPYGKSARDYRIGAASFTALGRTRRHVIEPSRLASLFGDGDGPPENVLHVVTNEAAIGDPKRAYRVLRVYQATGSIDSMLKKLRSDVSRAKASAALRPLVESGEYGWAVIVEKRSKLADVKQALLTPHRGVRLADEACFIEPDIGPTGDNLYSALSERKERKR